MRRLSLATTAVLLALAVVVGAGLAPAPAGAQTVPAEAEAAFVAKINALRASKGLSTLVVHDELTGIARSWAASMAEADQISHNPDFQDVVQADWQKLGENVGVGMTVDVLHDAFVASPTHYKNLVDPAYQYIGVGVVLGRKGEIFTAHQFMRLRSGAPPAATPPPTTAAPRPVATTAPPPPPPTTAPPRAADRPAVEEPARSAPGELVAPAADAAPAAAPAAPPEPPARLVLVLELLGALDPVEPL